MPRCLPKRVPSSPQVARPTASIAWHNRVVIRAHGARNGERRRVENLAGTGWPLTPEAADLQAQPNAVASARQIRHRACIAAMHPCGGGGTERARGALCRCLNAEEQSIAVKRDGGQRHSFRKPQQGGHVHRRGPSFCTSRSFVYNDGPSCLSSFLLHQMWRRTVELAGFRAKSEHSARSVSSTTINCLKTAP